MSALPAAAVAAEGRPAPPLSPGREALRVALAEVRAAEERFGELDQPVRALQAVIAEADQAEVVAAGHQAEHQQRVGAWLAGGAIGERPAPTHEQVRAERAAKVARGNADAAEKMLPEFLAPRNAALAVVNATAVERDACLVAAAVDAAAEVVESELKPKIEAMLQIEARLLGLRHALFLRANAASGAIPAAGGAGGAIIDLIRAAQAAVGVEQANAAGAAFLNALAGDPTAKL
jgi:hypothetical protein